LVKLGYLLAAVEWGDDNGDEKGNKDHELEKNDKNGQNTGEDIGEEWVGGGCRIVLRGVQITPLARGRGLGKLLISCLVAVARRLGVARVGTRAMDKPLLCACLLSMGFVPESRRSAVEVGVVDERVARRGKEKEVEEERGGERGEGEEAVVAVWAAVGSPGRHALGAALQTEAARRAQNVCLVVNRPVQSRTVFLCTQYWLPPPSSPPPQRQQGEEKLEENEEFGMGRACCGIGEGCERALCRVAMPEAVGRVLGVGRNGASIGCNEGNAAGNSDLSCVFLATRTLAFFSHFPQLWPTMASCVGHCSSP